MKQPTQSLLILSIGKIPGSISLSSVLERQVGVAKVFYLIIRLPFTFPTYLLLLRVSLKCVNCNIQTLQSIHRLHCFHHIPICIYVRVALLLILRVSSWMHLSLINSTLRLSISSTPRCVTSSRRNI